MDWKQISADAAAQHGLITRPQLADAGAAGSALERAVATGLLVRVRRRVYRIAGAPSTWQQRVLAPVLSAGRPAWSCQEVALAVWGLGPLTRRLEILVPRDRHIELEGIVVHRSIRIPAGDVTEHDGIPVTTPARTLLDLSGRFSAARLAHLADEADRRGLLTPDELWACREPWRPGRGRRLGRIEQVVAARSDRRAARSHPEASLFEAIMAAGLPRPEQNALIVLGGVTYEVDLAWRDHRVALEYDGWHEHRPRSRFDGDRDRDRHFASNGWVVVRATSSTKTPALVDDLHHILRDRAA